MTIERQDYSHETRPLQSRTARLVALSLGTFFVALGILGIFLPLLPTTPFLLLAAACYARASSALYNWLLNNRSFGPLIREWRYHRSIPYKVKIYAIALLLITIGSSALLVIENPYLRSALLFIGLCHAIFLYRIPSRDYSES